MGKTKKPVEGRKDQNFMLNWVIRTPRQRIEVKGTPGVNPSVNPHVTIGVSPPPTAGTSSFGATPILPPPALAEASSSGGTTTVAPPEQLASTPSGSTPLPRIPSSCRQVANFVITIDSSGDEEEQEVEIIPNDGNHTTSYVSALAPSDHQVGSSSKQLGIPIIDIASSEDEDVDGSFSEEVEGEQEVEDPPRDGDNNSSHSEDSDDQETDENPYDQAILHIGNLKERLSEDRTSELEELKKILKSYGNRMAATPWEWRDMENGSFRYMRRDGNQYKSASAVVSSRRNFRKKRMLKKKQGGGTSDEDLTEDEMKYINNHPCLHVLYFFSQQKQPFSTDRNEEEQIIEDFLSSSSSNLLASNMRWVYGQKARRCLYTYENAKGRLSLIPLIKRRIRHNKSLYKENQIAKGTWDQYLQLQQGYRNGNRRYFTYIAFGVNTEHISPVPSQDEQVNQFLADNPEFPLSVYLGVFTHLLVCEPDIRPGHYYDPRSSLFQFVQQEGKVYSGAVHQFATREKAAPFETYMQFAGFAAQDNGSTIKLLNKEYGAIIPSHDILEAIAVGERNPILTFGVPPNTSDIHDLQFAAKGKELTHKFNPNNYPPTSTTSTPTSTSDGKTYSVYIAIALPKEEVGNNKPNHLLARLRGDPSIKKKYYIGKSATADLKNGVRTGHMYDDTSPLLQAAKQGYEISFLKTISNLTEQEALQLESFYIFAMLAFAEKDPNTEMLNRIYGAVIPTELVKKAVAFGLGLTPVISFNCNESDSNDFYDLPLSVSKISVITKCFNV